MPSTSAVVLVLACNALHSAMAVSGSNPIRKVVTLLEGMTKNLDMEGEREKELFDKFVCYCKKGQAELKKSLNDNKDKAPNVQSDLEEAQSASAKLTEELKVHRANLAAAKQAVSEANSVRAKENKIFKVEVAEKKEYLAALTKALPALKNGMKGKGKAFMQTNAALAQTIRRAASTDTDLIDDERENLLAFLSMGQTSDEEYTPQGVDIVLVLQKMEADYTADVADMTAQEDTAANLHRKLVGSKNKEIKSVGGALSKKIARVGEFAVNIVTMKHDLITELAKTAEDRTFLQNLNAECATKATQQDKRVEIRGAEIESIHAAIGILNSDDALDLFKSTLGRPSSFLQVVDDRRQAAEAVLKSLRKNPRARPEVRFLEIALQGKKVNYGKVMKLIDNMVNLLEKEQDGDESKKQFCNAKLGASDNKLRDLKRSIKEGVTALDERAQTLKAIVDDKNSMKESIGALDKLGAEATKQRQEQNREFSKLTSSNGNAVELLERAQKGLKRFYQPEVAKRVALARTASTVSSMVPAWAGSDSMMLHASDDDIVSRNSLFKMLDSRTPALIQTTSSDGNKVISLLAQLIWKLETEAKLAGKDEERDQAAYQDFMKDSAGKRATYMKSINVRNEAKAENSEETVKQSAELAADRKDHKATKAYKDNLHAECDWLIKNFDLRRTARADEVDHLKKSKFVLQGASLVQAKPVALLSRGRYA